MRLWRRREPALRSEHARFVAEVKTALRGAMQAHAELPADRERLLAPARAGALAGRALLIVGQQMSEEMPKELSVFPALRALERATCSLVAHAQSPPDPTGALRPGELDALIA
jgi:hypothetical protein